MDSTSAAWIQFTPECWVMFPVKIENDSIVFFWSPMIDTKYEFDIVGTIRSAPLTIHGRPFMRLTLQNDSTLSASYSDMSWISRLNNSREQPQFFPDRFHVLYRDWP